MIALFLFICAMLVFAVASAGPSNGDMLPLPSYAYPIMTVCALLWRRAAHGYHGRGHDGDRSQREHRLRCSSHCVLLGLDGLPFRVVRRLRTTMPPSP